MTAKPDPISPDDIFARTASGSQATFDGQRALSAGFREMLKALDGRRTVAQLAGLFPQLDQEDLVLWLTELRRMALVEIAQMPFELPEVRIAPPGAAKAAPAPGVAKAAPAGEIDFDEMAASMADWVKENTEAFVKVRPAELNKTIQMATLKSSETLEDLEDSGYIANLMEPINFNAPAPPAVGAKPAPAAPAQARPAASAAKMKTALLFEDDAADLKLLAAMIQTAGYQVRASSTRQQFVTLLNGTSVPDVMFLKLGSRDVDAFKALEKLRLHPKLKDVAVVMVAAKPTREDIAKSILLGASGWMIKPYSADVIAAAVQGVLAFPAHLPVPPQ